MHFPPGYQVIVMAAGKGTGMPDLLAGRPKCLLPIGPKPLIWYTLNQIQSMGYRECIVIVLDNQKVEIQEAVDKSGLHIKVKYHTIPHKEDFGTADALRSVHEKITSDLIIVPCDLLTDINLDLLTTRLVAEQAAIVGLYFENPSYEGLKIPGPKTKNKEEHDIIFIEKSQDRLIYLGSNEEEELTIQKAFWMKWPSHRIYTCLVDSHVYVMKKWVLDYMSRNEATSSFRAEFLPYLVEKQISLKPDDEILKYANSKKTRELYPRFPNDPIRCFAYVADEEKDICLRVKTLRSFCYINSKLAELWGRIAPNQEFIFKSPNADIKSTQVDEKCIIWDDAKLSEKTSFKQSIIGPNVEINSFSRVFNCILMKNVVIKERVALENCIIADNSVIESKSHLTSCIVGPNQNIPEEATHENELLLSSEQ